MDHLEQDLNKHEHDSAQAELQAEADYSINLLTIVNEAKELTLDTSRLLSTHYIEGLETDTIIFISVMYEVNKLKFRHLPKSYRVELFEGICRDQAHCFEDYRHDLMRAD